MVERINIDNDAGNAIEPSSPLIEAAWFDGWLSGTKENPLNPVAKEASKKFVEDMEKQTGATMLAAIDAYAQIPVNTPEGANMWSRKNADGGLAGGIIPDWQQQCIDNHYTDIANRGLAILFTAEGEGQLKAGSLVPDVVPYDLRRGQEPAYVLSTYANGRPIGYDLGSAGLMSLYEAKKDVQLDLYDTRVSADKKAGLTPVLERILDDVRDVVDTKHDMSSIVSQLADKNYPQGGYDVWKQYLKANVMPMVEKEAWNKDFGVNGSPLQPINAFMRQRFVAKTWRDMAVLDLADIRHELGEAQEAENAGNMTEAMNQRVQAISKFLGDDDEKYRFGYTGVWHAIRNGQEQNNPDSTQLRDQAQDYGKQLEKYLEKLADQYPQNYSAQLKMLKVELDQIRTSRNN